MELGEQLEPGLAGLPVEAVEQPLRLEIDRTVIGVHCRTSVSPYNRKVATSCRSSSFRSCSCPGSCMPLHIFEERYKGMIGHCARARGALRDRLPRRGRGRPPIGCTARVDRGARALRRRPPQHRRHRRSAVQGDRPLRGRRVPGGRSSWSTCDAERRRGRPRPPAAREAFAELASGLRASTRRRASSAATTPTRSPRGSSCRRRPSRSCSRCARSPSGCAMLARALRGRRCEAVDARRRSPSARRSNGKVISAPTPSAQATATAPPRRGSPPPRSSPVPGSRATAWTPPKKTLRRGQRTTS